MATRKATGSTRGVQKRQSGGVVPSRTLGPLGNDLLGVAIGVMAVAMGVSLAVPSTAPLSHAVGQALILLFGAGAPLAPIALLLFGLSFFVGKERVLPGRAAGGLALVTCSVLALVSIMTPGADITPDLVVHPSVLGTRGGYVGGGVAWALLEAVGREVGIVILVGLAIAGTIVCGFSVTRAFSAAFRGASAARESLTVAHSRMLERRAEWRSMRMGDYDYGSDSSDIYATSEAGPNTSYLGSRTKSVLTRDEYPGEEAYEGPDYAYSASDTNDETWDPRTSDGALVRFANRMRTLLGFGTDDYLDEYDYLDDDPEYFEAYDSYPGDAEDAAWHSNRRSVEKPRLSPTQSQARGTSAARQKKVPAVSATRERVTPIASPGRPSQTRRYQPARRAASTLAQATREVSQGTRQEDVPSFLTNAPRRSRIQVNTQPAKECSTPARSRQNVEVALRTEQPATPSGAAMEETTPAVDKTRRRPVAKPSRPKATRAAAGKQKAGIGSRPGDGDETYALPPFSMLASNPASALSASSDAELQATMEHLQSTLAEFGLTSRVVDYVAGPLVTTFQIEMGEGERVSRITNLEDDIALTLAAESVRIFAPIPGTSRVGIEIPNKTRQNVYLRDVLADATGGPLEFAIGRDAEGRPVTADLASMPHLLVAGATGSGKSVMINSLIMSLLMRDTPKQVRLILVDPKRVEFSGYNGLPHLYAPVVTEPRQAASALQWAVGEMERRLKVFERAGARNILSYNEMCVSGKLAEMDNPPEPMPFMVIIIDELSDLMMVAGKDVEASIVRIAQLARAAGIHLVLATQRPSANVVTGLIKSNIETRIALSVASGTDSRVIIDQVGAQRLLGNGDMLFKARGNRTRRVLGCFVSDPEIEAVVDFIREQGEPDYHEEILQVAPVSGSGTGTTADDLDDDDPLVWEAAQIVVESQLGSTSGLQRRLKVGYARAGRIMDNLEAKGIVGPAMGSKPREVLLDEEGLEDLRVQEERYRGV